MKIDNLYPDSFPEKPNPLSKCMRCIADNWMKLEYHEPEHAFKNTLSHSFSIKNGEKTLFHFSYKVQLAHPFKIYDCKLYTYHMEEEIPGIDEKNPFPIEEDFGECLYSICHAVNRWRVNTFMSWPY